MTTTTEDRSMTIRRMAAHSEMIGPTTAGLYLDAEGAGDPSDDSICGPEGYALVDDEGRVQWLAEDCEAGTYRELPIDPTTGAYVLP